MYLALAAVAAAVVLGGHTLIRRWSPPGVARVVLLRGGAACALAAVLVLVILTQERNRIYTMPGGVWLDVIEKGRTGTRPYWNLALACDSLEGFDAAMQYADVVFEMNHDLDVYEHLAKRRLGRGDARTAEYLVLILHMQGKTAEAESLTAEHFEHVRSTLGDDHPWTRELMAIRAGTAADGDGATSDR
jgi:hypothetical protein